MPPKAGGKGGRKKRSDGGDKGPTADGDEPMAPVVTPWPKTFRVRDGVDNDSLVVTVDLNDLPNGLGSLEDAVRRQVRRCECTFMDSAGHFEVPRGSLAPNAVDWSALRGLYQLQDAATTDLMWVRHATQPHREGSSGAYESVDTAKGSLVVCPHAKRGCEAIVPYGDMEAHLVADCPFELCQLCHQPMDKAALPHHLMTDCQMGRFVCDKIWGSDDEKTSLRGDIHQLQSAINWLRDENQSLQAQVKDHTDRFSPPDAQTGADGEDALVLRVLRADGLEISFRLAKTTPLQQVLSSYSKQTTIPADQLNFRYYGAFVALDSTPESNNMQDGDVLFAWLPPSYFPHLFEPGAGPQGSPVSNGAVPVPMAT